MARIILVLCLLASLVSNAQYPPGYTGINQRYDWFLGKFRGLHLPSRGADDTTFLSTQWRGSGAVVIDTVNNKFYFYSNGQWREAGGIPSLFARTDTRNATGAAMEFSAALEDFTIDSVSRFEIGAFVDHDFEFTDLLLAPTAASLKYESIGKDPNYSFYFSATDANVSLGGNLQDDVGYRSEILITLDSMLFLPLHGTMNIDTLREWAGVEDTLYKKPMTWDTRNGRWEVAESWFGDGLFARTDARNNTEADMNFSGAGYRLNFDSLELDFTAYLSADVAANFFLGGDVVNQQVINFSTNINSVIAVSDGTAIVSATSSNDATWSSELYVVRDSMILKPHLGNLHIDTINHIPNPGTNKMLVWDSATGHVGTRLLPAAGGMTNPMTTTGDIIYSSDGSGTPARLGIGTSGQVLAVSAGGIPEWVTGGGSVTWDAIGAPTGDLALTFDAGESTTFTSSNTTETLFTMQSSTLTSASILSLVSTSTALAANNEALNIVMSGINGTSSITATGLNISVTNTGTTNTNIGLFASASGASTNNYAAVFDGGANTNANYFVSFQTGSRSWRAGTGLSDHAFFQNTHASSATAGFSFLTRASVPMLTLAGVGGSSFFNQNSADIDFGISGDTDANLFKLDAGLDVISIGGAAVSGQKLSLYGHLNMIGGTVKTAAGTTTIPSLIIPDGVVLTSPVAGAIEHDDDVPFFTITTGTARKEFILGDISLTPGRVPFATTKGRMTDVSGFTFDGANLAIPGTISTGDPGSGIGAWRLGTLQTATVTLNTTQYIEITIGGSTYRLATVDLP